MSLGVDVEEGDFTATKAKSLAECGDLHIVVLKDDPITGVYMTQ